MASPERGLRPKKVESESGCLAQLLLTVTPSERLTYISETSFLERSASQIAMSHCLQPQFEHKLLFSRRPCTDFLQCHAKKSPELATFTFLEIVGCLTSCAAISRTRSSAAWQRNLGRALTFAIWLEDSRNCCMLQLQLVLVGHQTKLRRLGRQEAR